MQFKRLYIKNFMAIGEAEIDLSNQGFVRISGVNNTDASTEHCGTGKSSIPNALHYVLCGETVKGGTDVKNIYTDGDCIVAVEFENGSRSYRIERSKGKSLRLFEDENEISGKGIRDTQALIEQMFPELTPAFVGATVIFGQKQPNAFTAHTASKRKEILEKLTKCDFQIEEIKERVAKKKEENGREQRLAEDERLVAITSLKRIAKDLEANQKQKDELVVPDADKTEQLKQALQKAESELKKAIEVEKNEEHNLQHLQVLGERASDNLMKFERAFAVQKEKAVEEVRRRKDEAMRLLRDEQDKVFAEIGRTRQAQEKQLSEYKQDLATREKNAELAAADVRVAQRELSKAEKALAEIEKAEFCPTCGKAWGDHKIDKEPYVQAVEKATNEYKSAVMKQEEADQMCMFSSANYVEYKESLNLDELKNCENQMRKHYSAVSDGWDVEIHSEIKKWEENKDVKEKQKELSELRELFSAERERLTKTKAKVAELEKERQDWGQAVLLDAFRAQEYAQKHAELEKRIEIHKTEFAVTEANITSAERKIDRCNMKAEQLNKLHNFATKRFRTILLEDTIEMLESAAQAIAKKYFDADIRFLQDGANIEIVYQGKQFEVLSGGEESAAVLIIQTALRELLFDLTGDDCNLLFIDEPYLCCDGALAERITELISNMNCDSVFLITHQCEFPADREMVVVKNNNIAEVQWA